MTNLLSYYFPPRQSESLRVSCDLCIYGGNAAGVIAAVSAARSGLDVVLIEPSRHLGGMTASGLGMTDFGNKAAVGGMAREFYRRAGHRYGVDEEWRFEPHIAEAVFEEMLAETDVRIFKSEFLASVAHSTQYGVPTLQSLSTESGLTIISSMFMDCSYEGDLMAQANVTHFVGREGNARYGESLNGQQILSKNQFNYAVDPYIEEGQPSSGLLPGIDRDSTYRPGDGDKRIQAYNFRMCLTQREDVRIPFQKPAAYDPAQYELLARYLRGGWNEAFRKFDVIRNGKTDTNNHGAVSTDYIGGSDGWPEGSYADRERIFQRHLIWQQGLQWFLANDHKVPAAIRDSMATWGLCRDEFIETGGWPHQLYIRESRRMISDHVITEAACCLEYSVAAPIGLGAYNMDSHHCRRIVLAGRVWNEGDVQVPVKGLYGIDYRSIIPRRGECGNLLVPVCLSSSHIAYGSLRMEPVFMVLGQSAATAAVIAVAERCTVQDVPYDALRECLIAGGQRLEEHPVGPGLSSRHDAPARAAQEILAG